MDMWTMLACLNHPITVLECMATAVQATLAGSKQATRIVERSCRLGKWCKMLLVVGFELSVVVKENGSGY